MSQPSSSPQPPAVPAGPAPDRTGPGRALVVALGLAVILALAGGGVLLYVRPWGTPAADGGRYETPQAVVAALESHGVLCSGYHPTPDPIGALSRGTCQIDGHDTIVSIYASEAEALAQPDRMNEFLGGRAPIDFVVGLDWTVNCYDRATAERVAAAIGGHIVHAGP